MVQTELKELKKSVPISYSILRLDANIILTSVSTNKELKALAKAAGFLQKVAGVITVPNSVSSVIVRMVL